MKQEILKIFVSIGTQYYDDPIRKAIYERKIVPNGNRSWMSIEEGVQRIRTEIFAFFGPATPIYRRIHETYQEKEKCDLTEIDYLKLPYPLLALPKQSPYLEIVKNG